MSTPLPEPSSAPGAAAALRVPGLPAWLQPAPGSLMACNLRRGRPAWNEFIHLLWTMWVFIVPMFTPQGYDARWWLLTAVSYPLFVALYVLAIVSKPGRARACAVGMVALCAVLLPWYPSSMSYFVFGCVVLGAGGWRSPWTYALLLAALNAAFLVWAWALGYPFTAVAWMPVTALVIGLAVHVERVSQQKDAALLLSQDEVRRLAATAERERIGRDLHDLLGHTLSLVALKADLAGRLLERDPRAAQREIGELGQVARDALGQVRRAVTGIRAAGLVAELAAMRLLLEGNGIGLEATLDDPPPPPAQETVLALCLREAATNIHRHANAVHVRVRVGRVDGHWQLSVEDDGRGGAIRPGNGLDGMRERLQALGGSLALQPGANGRGTRLLARLPHWSPAQAEPALS